MNGSLVVGAENVVLVPHSRTELHNPDSESIAASRPIPEGLEVVTALAREASRCVVSIHTTDEDLGAFWCRMNGLPTAAVKGPSPDDVPLDWERAQWNTIERVRAQGPVWLIVTASTSVYRKCTQTHQPVLLFGRRGGLEDTPLRDSWDEVQQRVRRRKEAEVEQTTPTD